MDDILTFLDTADDDQNVIDYDISKIIISTLSDKGIDDFIVWNSHLIKFSLIYLIFKIWKSGSEIHLTLINNINNKQMGFSSYDISIFVSELEKVINDVDTVGCAGYESDLSDEFFDFD